jgi:hypothetical protein
LTKCLCIEKHKRLEPYELKKYVFRPSPSNVLTEAKSQNIKLNASITSPKNQLFTKFNFQNVKTPSSKNTENISFNTTKVNNDIENSANKKELKKDTIKLISKQLISEIHFCRYMFKLLGRIR